MISIGPIILREIQNKYIPENNKGFHWFPTRTKTKSFGKFKFDAVTI